jgi:hypothetical protein
MAESGLKVGSFKRTLFGFEILNYLASGCPAEHPEERCRSNFAEEALKLPE